MGSARAWGNLEKLETLEGQVIAVALFF